MPPPTKVTTPKSKTVFFLQVAAISAFILGCICAFLGLIGFVTHTTLNGLASIGQGVAASTGCLWALAVGFYVVATFQSQQDESASINERFSRERFEQNFFSLLNLHHQIVD
jgi:hypothetical protein